MAPNRKRVEFALLKVSESPTAGEQFWIIRVDLERLSLGRSEAAINLKTAFEQLRTLGCSRREIDQLVQDARDVFRGEFIGE